MSARSSKPKPQRDGIFPLEGRDSSEDNVVQYDEYVLFRWANGGDPFYEYVWHPGPVIINIRCYGGQMDGYELPIAYPPPDQPAEHGALPAVVGPRAPVAVQGSVVTPYGYESFPDA